MKINSDQIRNLRAEAGWSQDELAMASGLTLRTVQRMENESKASMQSLKAVAGALDISSSDLELKSMNAFEYKALEISSKSLKKHDKQNLSERIQALLNKEGADGWELKQVIVPNYESTWNEGLRFQSVVAILQRVLS
ncbi:MAG: helix-turn-helix domain-containing protein [Pseudohongiellaceae bacterium]